MLWMPGPKHSDWCLRARFIQSWTAFLLSALHYTAMTSNAVIYMKPQ